ncbi:MAG TPA: helix-turn-helix domain-containing protein [Ktedonobacteraceae bacterium]|nr:helix-turn-helix domain-containing protein [Ktedonobacteraceae bacterium]
MIGFYSDPSPTSIQEICSTLRISRSTLYRYVKGTESPE